MYLAVLSRQPSIGGQWDVSLPDEIFPSQLNLSKLSCLLLVERMSTVHVSCNSPDLLHHPTHFGAKVHNTLEMFRGIMSSCTSQDMLLVRKFIIMYVVMNTLLIMRFVENN